MRLADQPSLPPAKGGRIRERESSREPDVMHAGPFANTLNKTEQDLGSQRSGRQEVAPKKGKCASASYMPSTIGAKKRNRLTSF